MYAYISIKNKRIQKQDKNNKVAARSNIKWVFTSTNSC